MKIYSIRFKIISVVIVSFLLTILITLYISARNQRNNLLNANEKTLSTNTGMLNETIKSIMLSGEAPIAVRTLKNIQKLEDIETIDLFRRDGTRAFHDYETLNFVNNYQMLKVFPKTERLKNKIMLNNNFKEVLQSHSPKRVELKEQGEMEYYFPILNLPDCRKCHGTDHFVRGVAYFKISTKSIHQQIEKANILLTSVFAVAGIIISLLLIQFLRRLIIRPVLEISSTVLEVSKGNFNAQVPVKTRDELGTLGEEINKMIKGIEERYKLSKYVSRKTESIISQKTTESTGMKQHLTVLFSDIRNFTHFSETHDPDTVIKSLNSILEVQADIVDSYKGDVDKFIGDAVMAIFTDEYTAVRCAYDMVKSVQKIDRKLKTGLSIGIGINSGNVVFGNIGGKSRKEYAVIGDTVNVASRLSGKAKANMILISETVKEKTEGKIKYKLISNQKIKGKTQSMNFYIVQAVFDETTKKWLR